jgi:hypothetical protein
LNGRFERPVARRTPAHPVPKLGLHLLALTVVRPGTLRGTPWAERAEGETLWRAPPERLKLNLQYKEGETREQSHAAVAAGYRVHRGVAVIGAARSEPQNAAL